MVLSSICGPACIDVASFSSLANSGAMTNNFVHALAFRVIPISSPDTFIGGFRCSSALSPPAAQNETFLFLFTSQLPLVNS